MSAEILQSESDIERSRAEMISLGIDCISPLYLQIARKLGLTKKAIIGDRSKSWDILKTIKLIQCSIGQQAPILDIGAYASEVLCALHRLGYSDLTGVDLNRNLANMPMPVRSNTFSATLCTCRSRTHHSKRYCHISH